MGDRVRDLGSWLYEQTEDEAVCSNRFHEVMLKVWQGWDRLDPTAPDEDAPETKAAQLVKAGLVLLDGDAIYVREGDTLHVLGDSLDLLAYYMHDDSKAASKAASLLETSFQGYFPVRDGRVWKDVMRIDYPDGQWCYVDLRHLRPTVMPEDADRLWPEYGRHQVSERNYWPIREFFAVMDDAVGEPWFFEKCMMWHFMQPYREKSQVLVGGGGNGKSMFMGLVKRLYGGFAMVDAPQPVFSGHAPAVIAYNFIGKRVVTFNDVGDPSAKFLEWLKRMITGNLEVKTPSGAWLSVPCQANFMMETNHAPEILSLEAHRRRFVIREFDPSFRLKDWLDDDTLDLLGDRGDITAGDIANYLLSVRDDVRDWHSFGDEPEDLDFETGEEVPS